MAHPEAEDGPASAGLIRQLTGCPALLQADHIVVGFSGGLDSTVLLHLLVFLRRQGLLPARLSALHVHHGLQTAADHWLAHCRTQAAAMEVDWIERHVTIAFQPGQSPEAAARDARYQVFTELMQPGTVLALAHHADDQVETVLLHLLRGSGPRGLAGMPRQRTLGLGMLCRPLLQAARTGLRRYAEQAGLHWIEDPSNEDLRFTRNQLRHTVLPALQAMAPTLAHSVARSAGLCGEAEQLLQELACTDLLPARCAQANQLLVTNLADLSPARLRNALRHWVLGLLDTLDGSAITHEALQHCLTQLLPARPDAAPVIAWGKGAQRLELRRHRGRLYLVKPLPDLPAALPWMDPALPLMLPGILGSVHCEILGKAPAPGCLPPLEVRFRHPGEHLSRPGRPGITLKRLLQESGVPPWLRPGVPLIYCEGRLLAVADLFINAGGASQIPEKTVRFRWLRQHLHCGH